MQTKVVIGLGYGDEGKGITTDYLCSQSENPLVIRFSGGHQAGHTVVTNDGVRHVFSSFGAGTLRGIPSYWSRYCTLYPIGFVTELNALQAKGINPLLYVDALTPVTTPFDVFFNQTTEKQNLHGSCGVGFGATMQRNEETPYRLYAQDLQYPVVLEQRLRAIQAYYEQKTGRSMAHLSEHIEVFKQVVSTVIEHITIVQAATFFEEIRVKSLFSDLIFEGSQGILLDRNHGFFPNVTRANTVSKNAVEMLCRYHLPQPSIYYVTRAYQTRHGNGFLSNEGIALNVHPNPLETNQYNEWQGHQRQSLLDLDMINYALESDANYVGHCVRNIVVTCIDQIEGAFCATKKGKVVSFANTTNWVKTLNVPLQNIFESHSDCSDVGFRKV